MFRNIFAAALMAVLTQAINLQIDSKKAQNSVFGDLPNGAWQTLLDESSVARDGSDTGPLDVVPFPV